MFGKNPARLVVGVIANPAAGRDVRRILGWSSISTSYEKVNMTLRLIAALGSQGIDQVLLMPDDSGQSKRVMEAVASARPQRPTLPQVDLVRMSAQGQAQDSVAAARLMAEQGAAMIAVIGGDGTHRAVAKADTGLPLATLAIGTNNAFPGREEATTVGMAAGLFLRNKVPREIALRRNKRMVLHGSGWRDEALVDICFSRQATVGARAVWREQDMTQVWVCFAEPWGIGLTSLAAMVAPVGRDEELGAYVRLGGSQRVSAMIMPGVISSVGIAQAGRFPLGHSQMLAAFKGTVAFDGERERELHGEGPLRIELDWGGPSSLCVHACLSHAAQHQLALNPAPAAMRR